MYVRKYIYCTCIQSQTKYQGILSMMVGNTTSTPVPCLADTCGNSKRITGMLHLYMNASKYRATYTGNYTYTTSKTGTILNAAKYWHSSHLYQV